MVKSQRVKWCFNGKYRLLRARGYKVDSLEVDTTEQEQQEPMPTTPPPGITPENPQIGYLSPLEQWIWTGAGWVSNTDDNGN